MSLFGLCGTCRVGSFLNVNSLSGAALAPDSFSGVQKEVTACQNMKTMFLNKKSERHVFVKM
jgi:hypothetical protein